jgi:hypothetical protein
VSLKSSRAVDEVHYAHVVGAVSATDEVIRVVVHHADPIPIAIISARHVIAVVAFYVVTASTTVERVIAPSSKILSGPPLPVTMSRLALAAMLSELLVPVMLFGLLAGYGHRERYPSDQEHEQPHRAKH